MSTVIIKQQGSSILEEVDVDLNNKDRVSHLKLDNPITGTVYGTLLNYKGEMDALSSELYEAPYKQPPKSPILYIKPTNTYTSFQSPIPLPEDTDELQVGASLGVVIGRNTTNVTEEEALDYVHGYIIVNDVSVPHKSIYRPAIKEKARDGFCPAGPWIVKKESIGDPNELTIRVFIKDELIQENTTANLIRPVQQLISEISKFMTLYEGDVLLVGVPENPPLVTAGDVVRIEIDGIGYLENVVIHESECLVKGRY